jgi:TolB-like protein/Flp pilus assembly protein TadD
MQAASMIGQCVSRYRILSKLGGGGMGVVYEAEDGELGRRVALKFLPEDLADNTEILERFKREARAASALNHPHICTVYDVGRHEGRPFIVMERMSGQSLKHLLGEGKLPVERVVDLGDQIADALDAAHRAGIVHRDLKPDNVFVTDRGEAKILDFGLAKLEEVADAASPSTAGASPPVDQLTTPGLTVGTVAYMSPEQARGAAVDGRSDLFSLGILLYRMASGRMPFLSVSAGDYFRAVLTDPPIPLSQIDPDVPPQLEEIVFKCLEKDPDLRYPTASGVRADLKRLRRDSQSSLARHAVSQPVAVAPPERRRPVLAIVAAAAIAVLGVAGYWVAQRRQPATAPTAVSETRRIAVLPFENLGDPEDGYFADGMADEVQSKLARLPGLAVIARGSTLEYRASAKRPGEIARELGVDYLLTATVRWQRVAGKSRIRVTPSLVEVTGSATPVTRWQEAFDADLEDVFAVQTRIATEVASALEMALGASQAAELESPPTSNLEAYDAYLQGRQLADRGFDLTTQRLASEKFEQAVALDPEFASAWARLALSRSLLFGNGQRRAEVREGARAAAERALALAPDAAGSYWAMAVYHRAVLGDPAGALEVLRRGLQVAPDDVNLLRNVGYAEQERGRPAAALEPMRRADFLDPRYWPNKLALANTLLRLHRPREAREVAETGLALSPETFDLLQSKLDSYLQEGDLAGAHALLSDLPAGVETAAFVAYLSNLVDSRPWALTPAQRDLLLRLEPGAFGGDRVAWASALAGEHWLRGDREAARRYAEEARAGVEERLADNPEEPLLHAARGSALAFLGRADEAVRAGERALELAPLDEDGYAGAEALHSLALVHVRLGQRERALDRLERLLAAPYWITPGWLRIDPNFDSLRGHPRFERLAAESPAT